MASSPQRWKEIGRGRRSLHGTKCHLIEASETMPYEPYRRMSPPINRRGERSAEWLRKPNGAHLV